MDVTTQRRCLGVLAAGLITGTVGAVGWAVSDIDPLRANAATSEPLTPLTVIPTQNVASQELSPSTTPLRRPLYDPPPREPPKRTPHPPKNVVIAPPTRPPATLEVKLVGTIIQSEESLAIVADASGKFDVKGVGEALELSPKGITVESIETERVTLSFQGRQSTIELDRSRLKATDRGNKRGNIKRRNNR